MQTRPEKLKQNATPKEIAAFMAAMRADAGRKADTSASIEDEGSVRLTLWPSGLVENGRISGVGSDWSVASLDLIQEWEAQRSNHRAVTIRKMAVGIIQTTADQGECAEYGQNFDDGWHPESLFDDAPVIATFAPSARNSDLDEHAFSGAISVGDV